MADLEAQEFDVVIVGGGSSGATLAARLTEQPGRSVLLLEAGTAWSDIGRLPPEVLDPSMMAASLPGHPFNWALVGALMPGWNLPVPRGKGLGGSSSINGANFVRGTKQNFDRWVELGNDEWSWDDVLPYYKRSETDHDYSGDLHGASGPVPIHREAPDQHGDVARAFIEACREHGFDEEPDKNAGGGVAGIGPSPTNIQGGRRVSSAIAYLVPNMERENLHIVGDAYVRRVVFEGERAVGVEVRIGSEVQTIRAGEVVITAGALRSPQILMLSGIGPAAHLAEHAIDVVHDAPGVGTGLLDHPEIVATYHVDIPTPALSGRSLAPLLLNWSSSSGTTTDLEIAPSVAPADLVTEDSDGGLFIAIGVMQEDSRGSVRLASDDPQDNPILTYNFLAAEHDRVRFREACGVLHDLYETNPMKQIGARIDGLHEAVEGGAEALDAWVRERLLIAGHPSSTCKMGPSNDPDAVVDQRGRVYGAEGLRVADTSIFPYLLSRGPAASAIMVGERLATFMVEDGRR
jgi:choline dehydrogenase